MGPDIGWMEGVDQIKLELYLVHNYWMEGVDQIKLELYLVHK
jgi:hypothetical protein